MAALHELCRAIAACERRDAVVLLAAALEDLAAGEPPIYFADLKEEAAEWAAFANPLELEAYYQAIRRRLVELPQRARRLMSARSSRIRPSCSD